MRPYYQSRFVTLYHGRMEHVLPELHGRFDAIVTDPPYNETALEWDTWVDGWPDLLRDRAPQMWSFGSFRMFWEHRDEFAAWKLAQDCIWEKHNGTAMHKDRFRRVHEMFLHFYRGEWGEIHKRPPIIEIEERRPRTSLLRGKKPEHWGGVETGTGYAYDGKRYERSVMRVRSCHGYAVNETQKPEGIVRPLLEYSVPPGGMVLDPFAGSGTVLAVAQQLGLMAVGIEMREAQCEEIAKRLQTTLL